MYKLCNTKYVEIEVNLKSWGIGIDWDHKYITRPIYIAILCIHFEFGIDPYGGRDE